MLERVIRYDNEKQVNGSSRKEFDNNKYMFELNKIKEKQEISKDKN